MRAATKVVGMVAGGRQHVVAHVREGDPALLVPEPTNPYDRHAIAVFTAPRHVIRQPDVLVSSVADPDHVGNVAGEDRQLLMDRQAGYVPREVAKRLALPPGGVVGYVSAVRFAPPECDGRGQVIEYDEPRVAGFDVTAWLPQSRAAVTADAAADAALAHEIDSELEWETPGTAEGQG